MGTEQDPWGPKAARSQEAVFRRGMACWRAHDIDGALGYFREADQKAESADVYSNLYTSYHGVALVFKGDISGLNFCRQAASMESSQADVFCNLAMVEYRLNHRRRAHAALMKGLKISPRHPELNRLRQEMGVRRAPVLGFLSRDNLLNRLLGKMTYPKRYRKMSKVR